MIDVFDISISIAAFLLSIGMWIHTLIKQQVKISARIDKYYAKKHELQLFIVFENNSQLPVSITRILLCLDNDKRIDCLFIPVPILSRHHPEYQDGDGELLQSIAPPIYLLPLAAYSGFVVFREKQDNLPTDDKEVKLEFCTSRCKKIYMTLQLPEEPLTLDVLL